jgi:hypothetical protein
LSALILTSSMNLSPAFRHALSPSRILPLVEGFVEIKE